MAAILNFKVVAVSAAILAVFAIMASSAFAKTGGTRPGWGFGDKNHVHTGPPGQSVHP